MTGSLNRRVQVMRGELVGPEVEKLANSPEMDVILEDIVQGMAFTTESYTKDLEVTVALNGYLWSVGFGRALHHTSKPLAALLYQNALGDEGISALKQRLKAEGIELELRNMRVGRRWCLILHQAEVEAEKEE